MSPVRFLGFGKKGAEAPSHSSILGDKLRRQGLSGEALERAEQRRLVLNTRLASALVEQGDLDEVQALRTLSQIAGLPAVALRRSIVNLSTCALPEALVRERNVLPVSLDEEGAVLVACADSLDTSTLQTLELALGKRVRPHVALQYYLRRTIQAALELRRQCPDATFLLGDGVEAAERVENPAGQVALVVPQLVLPGSAASSTSESGKPAAVLGVAGRDERQRIAQGLAASGMRVVVAEDGPSALRQISALAPELIILDAQLPKRSGLDIVQRLQGGERYRAAVKVLLVPPTQTVAQTALKEVSNLRVVTSGELEAVLGDMISGLVARGGDDDLCYQRRAQAAYHRGRALVEEEDLDGAARELASALQADPLHAEAHRELAEIHRRRSRSAAGADACGLAADLGMVGGDDLTLFAELLQGCGNFKEAARVWDEAAGMTPETGRAAALREHAAALRDGTAASREPGQSSTT